MIEIEVEVAVTSSAVWETAAALVQSSIRGSI